MLKKFGFYFEFTHGSWKEFLTALLPFFLAGGVLPLLNYLGRAGISSGAVGTIITLFLFGLLIFLLVVGLRIGMPRWALPHLGFVLSILSLYLFSAVFGTPIYLLFHDLRDKSLLFIDILWGGIYWYGLLFATIVLMAMTNATSTLQRFKSDWTLVCFIVYGAVPFALWLTFDEYVGEEPYLLLAFLVLALGTWSYLRSANEWKRFWILFGALNAVMFIVTAGKAILVPSQTWPFNIDVGLVRSEVKSTIIMWFWFALIMCLPLANNLLSRMKGQSHTGLIEG